MGKPAVFLDRDGTIIRDAEYLADPAGVELLEGAAEGMRQLQSAGFLLIMTTNQSGVARGYFKEETVHAVNGRLHEMLHARGVALDGVYYCPHHVKGSVPEYSTACDCRKPKPGMIRAAQKDFNIDLSRSWVIGDKLADVQFGKNLRLGTVLVLTGYGSEIDVPSLAPQDKPDHVAPDLGRAAQWILDSRPSAPGIPS